MQECPMCLQSRPSLLPSPLGPRCQRCLEEGVVPSERTQIRLGMGLIAGGAAFVLLPPLLLLWLPWQAIAAWRWAPAYRGKLLGGILLLASIWILLIPELISISTNPVSFSSSTGGTFILLFAGVLLLLWFWPAVRISFFELLFRGRGFAAGVLRSGGIIAIAATFLLAAMPLFFP